MRNLCTSFFFAGALIAQDTGGWIAMGQGGTIRPENGGIVFRYDVKPKQFALAVLPAPAEFAGLGRLRFRVKTDRDTALAVILSERKPGGGNFTAPIWSPANTWQTIELSPEDFAAADGANDPVDADGRLDLDQVEGIAVADMAPLFLAQRENGDFPVAVDAAPGARAIWIAGFEVIGGDARPAGMAIDRFDRGFLSWLTIGGMRLAPAAKENPLGEPAMEVAYRQEDGRFGVLIRRLTTYDLSKAARIAFDIASEKEATFIVSLETKKGERYNLSIYPPGKKEVFHVSLRLEDFEGPGKLAGADLKSLGLTDVTGGGGENRIWVGKVEGREK